MHIDLRRLARKVIFVNERQRQDWIHSVAVTIPASARVLDVGAGSSPYRGFFSHCDYKSHDFAQLRPDQLAGRKGYAKLDYISDITAIPTPDASFDVVICTEVLEHVPEPIRAVHEFARIIKPGGKLILTAPLGSELHQEPYHYYGGYTPHWYRKFLAEAGFDTITIEANGGFFESYSQESQRFVSYLKTGGWKMVPVWTLLSPWFWLICPILCRILRPLDRNKSHTVGYHVIADRSLKPLT
jgi:SAM-dependent methyltransferase